MARIATRLYENQGDLERLWQLTFDTASRLNRTERIAYFIA